MAKQSPDFLYIASREDEYNATFSIGNPEVLSELILDAAADRYGIRQSESVWTTSGGRFYVEINGLYEYATPECGDLGELTAHSIASEQIVTSAVLEGIARYGRTPKNKHGDIKVQVHKKNAGYTSTSSSHSQSSAEIVAGSHENYNIPRWLFPKFMDGPYGVQLASALAIRTALFGAGFQERTGNFRVGAKVTHHTHTLTGSRTTENRSLINTRNEPHADDLNFARLHVTTSDSLISPWSMYTQTGFMHLFLRRYIDGKDWPEIALENPIEAALHVARDTQLRTLLRLRSGKRMTSLNILEHIIERSEVRDRDKPFPPDIQLALSELRLAIDEAKNDPNALISRSDWVTKKRIIDRKVGQDPAKAQRIAETVDGAYGMIHPVKGYGASLRQNGGFRLAVSDEQIREATTEPPVTSRAFARGALVKLMRHTEGPCGSVKWSEVIINSRSYPMGDPADTYAEHIQAAYEQMNSKA